jgi:hypothetical protein
MNKIVTYLVQWSRSQQCGTATGFCNPDNARAIAALPRVIFTLEAEHLSASDTIVTA